MEAGAAQRPPPKTVTCQVAVRGGDEVGQLFAEVTAVSGLTAHCDGGGDGVAT